MTLLAKLGATLREHELVNKGDVVVVGVSGGPDSLTLLHALKALSPEFELKLVVAHLNHQLRGAASDADEEFVVALARAWGLPVANARWDVRGYAHETGMSIEEAARMLRYQFLAATANQVHARAVAVAHNADDQVETILLHFLRGAGLSGLRGMAYKSNVLSETSTVTLIRPLLDVNRSEIDAYCAEHGLESRIDETNRDTTILRNRLRHEVIPYLETINPNLREVMRHSALSVADDYDYIQQNVLGIFDRMTRTSDGAIVFDRSWFRALPVNLQRGVLRQAVSRLRRLKNIGYRHIENARRVAADKDAGAEATLPQGLFLVVGYDDFTIGEHMPVPDVPLLLQEQEIVLAIGTELQLPESDWSVRVIASAPSPFVPPPEEEGITESPPLSFDERGAGDIVSPSETTSRPLSAPGNMRDDVSEGEGRWRALFDRQKLGKPLLLRPRRAGERFAPRGMGGKHKSLHEFMIDEKIPRHLRDYVPILADQEKVLWVVGYRQDERASVNGAAPDVIEVRFFKG